MEFEVAKREDTKEILEFIKLLADYENLLDEVVTDEDTLAHWLFDEKKAEVIFVKEGDIRVGFALYFYNFSTFLGKAGLYLEDLFVKEEYRHQGYGKALINKLGKIANEKGLGRFEWWCLDSNTPSIDFYMSLGAKKMDEWTVYRIDGETLNNMK